MPMIMMMIEISNIITFKMLDGHKNDVFVD